MDEGLLNDLLECSVCLERLDTSSRVLPCQHTFCLKCLKVIVESHKELRCPECRILVETKVEELPPNVLLMRILEGMRNATPRKAVAPGQRASRVAQLHQQAQQSANQSARNEGEKQQPPPYARAIHDYKSKEIGDLSFKKGETILLLKRLDPFWYQGECSGRTGIFPITYVQVMVPLPIPTALCKALYDFRMSAPDEEGCLAFDKGAIITVHRRVDENWAEGRVDERLGIFPIAFVELNHAARQLINSPTLNRPVPPPPSRSRNDLPMQVAHRIQHMTMSTPSSGQHYPNVSTMSQSQPNSHTYTPMSGQHHPATMLVQPITSVPRHMPEHAPKQLDFIHLANISNKSQTVGLQSVSRINEGIDRLRSAKYDNYTTSHKNDSTYQNVRIHEHYPNAAIANFNTNSSESSSSANTPSVGISSTTSPNSSSSTSSCESAEPSLPSSPDNGERNATLSQNNTPQNTTNEIETENQELNSSIGVLSLNESSTATNTSLNVSLPTENQIDVSQEGTSKSEPNRLEVPSSSKVQNPVRSGPESLMNFGLGLQAALSPVHARPHKEKRHSLTPPTHLNASQHANTTQNRHSAEILQTSLLDAYPETSEGSSLVPSRSHSAARERDRRRRSRSSECPLPATYVALYPYRPQKPDELELRKGALYTVTERCRDGWFKGHSEREQRAGVFPGNYVAHRHDKGGAGCAGVPAAPPRGPLRAQPQQAPYPWGGGVPSQTPRENTPKTDKAKERSKLEKTSISSGVNLMKRLAAMKKCKSPPPGYSMDNPVFEDSTVPSTSVGNQHVHVRSGSCPTQLLSNLSGSHSTRATRHKQRPSVLPQDVDRPMEGPWQTQHRKSQSLDATAAKRERDRHHTQTVKERFRCIVPYPPNSEYELELKVDDIVVVHRKRGDGWYKGTLQRTGRCGLFPASFVQSCPAE